MEVYCLFMLFIFIRHLSFHFFIQRYKIKHKRTKVSYDFNVNGLLNMCKIKLIEIQPDLFLKKKLILMMNLEVLIVAIYF